MLPQKHWIWASLALIFGIFVGWQCDIKPLYSILLTIGNLFLALYIKQLTHFLIVGIFFSIGTLLYSLNPYPNSGDDIFNYLFTLKPNSYIDVEGVVISSSLPDKDNRLTFVLAVNKIRASGEESKQIYGNVQIYVNDGDTPIYTHEKVKVRGKSSLYLSPTNFYTRGYEDYLRAHRIYSRLVVRRSDIQKIGQWILSPLYWSSRLRYSTYKFLQKNTPENTIGLIKALWLGDRSDLTNEEREFFSLSGTAHILAISGLHIGIIFFIVKTLLDSIFKERETLTNGMGLVICLIYSVITGLHGSSVRALAMLFIGTLYFLTQRKVDLVSALAITVAGILIVNPDYLWDIGTQMSIVTVLSILLFYQPLRKMLIKAYIPGILARPLAVTLSAQILLIPFLTIISNRINLLSPLINLLVVPIMGIFLTISLICLPLLFSTSISTPLLNICSFFVLVTENICKWSANQNWAILTIPSTSSPAILLFLLAVFLFYELLVRYSPHKLLYFPISMLILILLWKGLPSRNEVEINILDVSHGDCILISLNNKEHMLIDGGKKEMGKRVTSSFLRSKGINTIDIVIPTHADEDHIGGLFEILNNFEVKQFLYGGGLDKEDNGKDLLSLVDLMKIPSKRLHGGEHIKFRNGAQLKILYCGEENPSNDTNSNSIVAKLTYKDFSILLTGDFPANKASTYLNQNEARALILKLPHHGLKNSVNEDFLNIVNPQIAISSGNEFHNNWGVRTEVKKLLKDRKIPLFRTDSLGGIQIKSNGETLSIEGARQKRGYKILRDTFN